MTYDPKQHYHRVKVPWGTFGPNGYWAPNPLLILRMSAGEQYRQNTENGYKIGDAFVPKPLEN